MGETCSRLVVGKGGLPPLCFAKVSIDLQNRSRGQATLPDHEPATRFTHNESHFTHYVRFRPAARRPSHTSLARAVGPLATSADRLYCLTLELSPRSVEPRDERALAGCARCS